MLNSNQEQYESVLRLNANFLPITKKKRDEKTFLRCGNDLGDPVKSGLSVQLCRLCIDCGNLFKGFLQHEKRTYSLETATALHCRKCSESLVHQGFECIFTFKCIAISNMQFAEILCTCGFRAMIKFIN